MWNLLGNIAGAAAGKFFGGGAENFEAGGVSVPQASPAETGINSVFRNVGESSVGKGIEAGIATRAQHAATGIPQPGDYKAQGAARKAYNDAAFPGTNPWEQNAGSGGSSSAPAAAPAEAARFAHERALQKEQLKTEIQKARIGATATVDAAVKNKIPEAGTPGHHESLRTQAETDLLHQRENFTAAEILRVDQLVSNLHKEGAILAQKQKISESEATLAAARAKLAKEFAGADLSYKMFSNSNVLLIHAITEFAGFDEAESALASVIGKSAAAAVMAGLAAVTFRGGKKPTGPQQTHTHKKDSDGNWSTTESWKVQH